MTAFSARAMVVTRHSINDARDVVKTLGGGWRTGLETWAAMPRMGYALLLAPDRMRIRKAAPFVMMAADRAALLSAVDCACTAMKDVTCEWILPVPVELRDELQRSMLQRSRPVGGVQ
jgi:hypothetical protein